MEGSYATYLVIVCVGALACAIASRSPGAALALWMMIFPLVADASVPEGFEKLPPTRIVHVMLAGVVFARGKVRSEWFRPSSLLGIYGMFLAAAIASAILSDIGGESVTRAVTYAEPATWMLLGLAAASPGEGSQPARKLLAATAIGFGLVALLAVPEVIKQENYLASWGLIRTDRDYMLDTRLGVSGRISSTIGQPVYAGVYGLLCVATLHLLIRLLPRARRVPKLALTVFLFVAIAFVFLTGTRAALIGLAIYPLILAALARDGRALLRLVGVYAIGIALTVALLPSEAVRWWSSSFEVSATSSASANVLGRLALTKRLIEVFLAHPWLGIGPGFVQKAVLIHGAASLAGLEGVESQYATLLAENGAIGFVLLAAFFVFAFHRLTAHGDQPSNEDEREFGLWTATLCLCVLLIAASCTVLQTIPSYFLMAFIGCAVGRKLTPQRAGSRGAYAFAARG